MKSALFVHDSTPRHAAFDTLGGAVVVHQEQVSLHKCWPSYNFIQKVVEIETDSANTSIFPVNMCILSTKSLHIYESAKSSSNS